MPVERRDEYQRSEIHKGELVVNPLAIGFRVPGISRHQIPFVDGENQPFTTLKGICQDLRILVGHPFGPIQEVDHQISPIHGSEGPDHTITLNPIDDSGLAADPSGVHEGELLAAPSERTVHSIPRCPWQGVDHRAFKAKKTVYQSGLADIGPSHDSQAQRMNSFLFFLLSDFIQPAWKSVNNPIHQLRKTESMLRRQRKDLA